MDVSTEPRIHHLKTLVGPLMEKVYLRFTRTEAEVPQEEIQSSQMDLNPCPDPCLASVLSQGSTETSWDLVSWFFT